VHFLGDVLFHCTDLFYGILHRGFFLCNFTDFLFLRKQLLLDKKFGPLPSDLYTPKRGTHMNFPENDMECFSQLLSILFE